MARNSYDDISDNRVSRRGSSSSKVLLVVILMSILICAIAVLCWVKILETQDTINANGKASVKSVSSESDARSSDVAMASENVSSAVQEEPAIQAPVLAANISVPTVDSAQLSIDAGLSNLEGYSVSGSDMVNYISSSDYTLASDLEDSEVVEESVEMKKPTIAQNLSFSQQSSFSKNLVRYQQYSIKEGDSLISIAEMFGLSLQTIISVNQIKSATSLFIGSTLQIPDRDGSLYSVAEGDTLFSITQQFGLGISAKTLGDINGTSDSDLVVGQKLFIPSETRESSGTISAEEAFAFVLPCDESGIWVAMYNQKVPDPLTNSATVLDGVLLQAAAGSPVFASENGTVVDKGFNDNGSAFIKIMHNNGYTTYYDYLSDVLVDIADKVSKGQQIGKFGDGTTNLLNPTLFFKIEQDGVALDPYSFY